MGIVAAVTSAVLVCLLLFPDSVYRVGCFIWDILVITLICGAIQGLADVLTDCISSLFNIDYCN